MSHPYQQFAGTQLWREIDAAISALEANQDLQLTTARDHVVVYASVCSRVESLQRRLRLGNDLVRRPHCDSRWSSNQAMQLTAVSFAIKV